MKQKYNAVITGVSGIGGLWEFSIKLQNVPLDFGLDGKRLKGRGPHFWLTDVVGYDPKKLPKDYKEFGPNGLAVGVHIICKVDDCLPEGLVLHDTVHPPKNKLQPP